eukprot:GHRR01002663.1.p1 GENE.GHRR01002663.1~~GHRR01002663.1.p1  ORF type:complete len:254 (+),score=64.25 GHRR01002663.1:101-862(+)
MAVRLILSSVARRPSSAQQIMPAVCNALTATTWQHSMQAEVATPSINVQQLAASNFHTSSLVSASSLSSILGKELKHEKTVYEQDEVVAKGPPAPFTLQSTPGDTAVSLTRDYNGEKISVDCSVNMQDSLAVPFSEEDEESEGDTDDVNDVTFNVTVAKGDKALVFECLSDGTYMDIRHVSLEPAEGLDSETAYTGPVFAELDSELQDAFREYIAERGINEDMGEYLRHLMYDKEQQEYMRWLESVKGFVGSS